MALENKFAELFPSDDSFVMPGDANVGTLTLNDTLSVPNPAAGKVTFYSDGSELYSRDPSGNIQTFLTTGGSSNVVQSDGNPSVAGNIPEYVDATGQLIEDSGVSIASLGQNQLAQEAVLDQVYGVAPAGQRDLWQYTDGGAAADMGGQTIHNPASGQTHSFGTVAGVAAYSVDGGVNWLPCVFNVVSAGPVLLAFNGTDYVAVGLGTTDTYTSADGINFTQGAAAPATFDVDSQMIDRYNGLFITGVTVDATHNVATSPTGVTWTVRVSGCEFIRAAHNSSIVVSVGSTAPFIQSSTNGTTWTNTASVVAACRAVTWSEEKAEFIAIAYATGEVFRSTNGTTWTSLGLMAPVNVNSVIWVAANSYNRYYVPKEDTDGNYSLWSTTAADLPFVGTNLDGAVNNSPSWAVIYIEADDRFAIGLDNTPFFAYGTARPLDIKSLADNIRVRNMPVSVSTFSSTGDAVITGTAAETPITPASSIGSLVYQDGQPVGMVIDVEMNTTTNTAAGDTLTVRFKINNVNVYASSAIALGAGASMLNIRAKLTVRAATIITNATLTVDGVASLLETASAAYNPSIANTLSFSGQWGVNTSDSTTNQLVVTTHFRNGA